MKKLFSVMAIAMMILSVMPVVLGNSVGSGVGITIEPEEFAPLAWMCDQRSVTDDAVQSGRNTIVGEDLNERNNNYAFEGEQISWDVLVMDKNKIEEIEDVVATVGDVQGEGNDIEVECVNQNLGTRDVIPDTCNARILEERLTGYIDPATQAMYTCTFTVETPDSMYGEYWITVEAIGTDGQSVTLDENEFWFLNPTIALSIDGDLEFTEVRPGAVAYSDTLLVGNDADDGSGVLLDMFISGTDFYDSASSGARCPVTNQLKLSQDLRNDASLGHELASGATHSTVCNADTVGLTGVANADHICYFATSGAYSSSTAANADTEGYRPIVYGDSFTRDFYNDAEIISNDALSIGGIAYDAGNVLTPGAEIAMTFKLGLPEPCVGNFDSGDIFFWGEAI
jgi:hypothetical protein